MKKRIVALFLALCLVAAMIPGVAAAELTQGLHGPARIVGSSTAITAGTVASAQDADILPMANPADYALVLPGIAYQDRSVVAGSAMNIQCLYLVGDNTITQYMGISVFKGDNEIAFDSWALYQPDPNSAYTQEVTIDTADLGMGSGDYTVFFYIFDENDEIVEDSVSYLDIHVYTSPVYLSGLYFADFSSGDFVKVNKLNVARGFNDISAYILYTDPANATADRACSYTSSDSSILQADSWAGYLYLTANGFGTATITGEMSGRSVSIPVDICIDDQGHNMTDVVTKAPTCTEAGTKVSRCSKCGYTTNAVEIAPTSHTWDAGVIIKEETEDAYGEKLFTCTVCGAKETRPYHTCPGSHLVDMPKDTNWAHKGIDYCLKNNLMVGVDETHFMPNDSITRGQLVTILWRQAGSPQPASEAPFTDLTQKYYRQAIAWAYEQGIAKGITDTTFQPNTPVTREQFATFVYRFAAVQGRDVTARADLGAFPDNSKVSKFAQESLSWAVSTGLISGVGDGAGTAYLQPKSGATRAQAATILMRYCESEA